MTTDRTWAEQWLNKRWVQHSLFWIVVTAFLVVIVSAKSGKYEIGLLDNLFLLPMRFSAAYLLAYWLLPMIERREYLRFVLWFLPTFYILTTSARIATVHGLEEIFDYSYRQEPISEILTDLPALLAGYAFRVYTVAFLFLMVKSVKGQLGERRKRELIEQEKAKTELNFLKAQMHPHFLFNTLNNLYALTLKKSDKAPETVLKLSEMLDYMLYQCSDPRVPLRKEIDLLQNYIDLEKLRYGDRLELEFYTEMDDQNARIAPLVLLSMVENAFKHGASGAIDKPVIRISLVLKAGQLQFRVWNSRPPKQQKDETDYSKGIGVSNIQRQLELTYPDAHRLETEAGERHYQVNLTIDLQDKG